MKKISVHMKIDERLYSKSKTLIPNRTKDYEDYLRRMIASNNRLEMLQKEQEELQNRMGYLDKEIDLEMDIKDKMKELENEAEDIINQALKTVINIIHNEGVIGLDRLEEIANYKRVSSAELRSRIPKELGDRIVNYHPKVTNDARVEYS